MRIHCHVPAKGPVEYLEIQEYGEEQPIPGLRRLSRHPGSHVVGFIPVLCVRAMGVRMSEPIVRGSDGNCYPGMWFNLDQSVSMHKHKHWVTPEQMVASMKTGGEK